MAKTTRRSKANTASQNQDTAMASVGPQMPTSPSMDMVAEAAYYKAEKRGFVPGYEMQDWLEAEQEVSENILAQ